MSKVFVNIGLSLDGYMAPEGMTMGKRMFDQGEVAWPEEAPFHTPVYVVNHEKREPWERPGGTTFYFVTDGPERALELARESAGSRDIRIAGGADVIQQYLNLGVVDELEIALAPVLFGGGRRLFENVREPGRSFASTGFLMAQPPHTCAMCVSEGGPTPRSSGAPTAGLTQTSIRHD